MALEEITLENTPPSQDIYAALFRNVSPESTQHIQKQLLARNPVFEYALVDATSIVSRAHLLSAVFNAVNAATTDSLTTPNVHSEIVLSLSPNNNISDAYRRWGIQAGKTSNLIAVKVVPRNNNTETSSQSAPNPKSNTPSAQIPSSPDEIWDHLIQHLQHATPVPLTDEELAKSSDWTKIRKYYKLNGVPALDAIKDEGARKKEMERLAIMGMALRGI